MQAQSEVHTVNPKLERIANILRLVSWVSLWLQLGLGAASVLMLIFAISGRSFNQAVTPTPGAPGVVPGVVPGVNYNQETIPGVNISIFWGVCGIIALLFTSYLAFRITRFAKRLRHPDSSLHPKKADVMKVLRIAVIAGFVGMLLTILGGGSGLGVLLSKSIAQPQGVAIYDPTRIIRSLDIFVAMASMTGITAHYVGTAAALGLFNWLHPEL
ncbi:DUF3611 family protein [Chlorogloeopsis fritschii PCC 9212]|uniref:DUF3611 family protein n=1 Tax=Chlorogloeopsis fritschii PCC 6912 TaxID=211165 RepID=A0A433MY59_CHLFR|nr:DUF3611 family protein [Chlorogloeopsis fritschii]MBF2009068.1 DUF3611 family protein [Chlorogloeopsis fritschii C42_A2020_084]RUR73253.1 hypothetical protein PCC6912_57780 [Chlorogloeopsis fritschii PCC 6912]